MALHSAVSLRAVETRRKCTAFNIQPKNLGIFVFNSHVKQWEQQVSGGDAAALLCSHGTPPATLCTVLVSLM